MRGEERKTIGECLRGNSYVGRGIVVGKSQDGRQAVFAYFIMGRSANSRNRVFRPQGQEVAIYLLDQAKVTDPSLILYTPVRVYQNQIVVSNGDQTDTIYQSLAAGGTFEEALETRCFEPDAPNFTPRISALLTLGEGDFTYKMSILKSADPCGTGCNRFTFSYAPVAGLGHFLHTYTGDGTPLPSFTGEPRPLCIPNDADAFGSELWDSLDRENRIALFYRAIDLETGKVRDGLINKYGG